MTFARLSTLGAGGRASATTILSLTAARRLRENPQLDTTAQKMLSFTDNRQDASLQAGHFNDFVEVTMLRSALWQAVSNSPDGLRHDELPRRVFDALRLSRGLYALDPDVVGQAEERTDKTMREVLEYRVYHDLKRGWRVSQPNLEQTGLLVIEYMDLAALAGDQEMWADCHQALAECNPERRIEVLEVLLDALRRDLVLNVRVLGLQEQESLQRRAGLRLTGTWSLDREQLTPANQAVTYPKASNDRRAWIKHVTARGLFGAYLRGTDGLAMMVPGRRITLDEADGMIKQIFERLRRYGLVMKMEGKRPGRTVADKRLVADLESGRRHPPLPGPAPRPPGARWNADQPVLCEVVPRHGCLPIRNRSPRAHRAGVLRKAHGARETVPHRRSTCFVLLADHGTGSRHFETERGEHAERSAYTR